MPPWLLRGAGAHDGLHESMEVIQKGMGHPQDAQQTGPEGCCCQALLDMQAALLGSSTRRSMSPRSAHRFQHRPQAHAHRLLDFGDLEASPRAMRRQRRRSTDAQKKEGHDAYFERRERAEGGGPRLHLAPPHTLARPRASTWACSALDGAPNGSTSAGTRSRSTSSRCDHAPRRANQVWRRGPDLLDRAHHGAWEALLWSCRSG